MLILDRIDIYEFANNSNHRHYIIVSHNKAITDFEKINKLKRTSMEEI